MASVRWIGWRTCLTYKVWGVSYKTRSEACCRFVDGYANLFIQFIGDNCSEMLRLCVESGTSLPCHKCGTPFKLLFITGKSF